MVERFISSRIAEHIANNKILVLLGARGVQKGNTVLHLIEDQDATLLLDVSNKKVKTKIEKIEGSFIPLFENKKYVLIRDAQLLSNLQSVIEELLNSNTETHLILLCSYEPVLDKVLRDVLLMEGLLLEIYPPLFQEIANAIGIVAFDKQLEDRLIFGNYPKVLEDKDQAGDYLIELVKDAIFTNLNPNERINKGDKLVKMMQALAFDMGEPISYYDIGQRAGLDNETVERYIDLLEKAFILKKIPCYYAGNKYELKKTHTVYFMDNGIRNAIIQNFHPIDLRNDISALWKNWLIAERIKWNAHNGNKVNYFFWRTHTRQQMDFIEEKDGKLMAYKSIWDKRKKPKFPASFKTYYPDAGLFALNKSTYWGFLSKK